MCERLANVTEDLRLDGKDYAFGLGDRCRIIRANDGARQLFSKCLAVLRERLADQDMARLVTCGEHPAGECSCHIAAAHKGYFSVIHRSPCA